jgi:hypothetical protein
MVLSLVIRAAAASAEREEEALRRNDVTVIGDGE